MFTRRKFLLVTVKEWLQSVLNYRSHPRNKTGYPFLNHPVLSMSVLSFMYMYVLLCVLNKNQSIMHKRIFYRWF